MRIKLFLRLHYLIQLLRKKGLSFFVLPFQISHKICQVLIGMDFSDKVQIGKGLIIDHGQGLVVHQDVQIGNFVRLRNNVTIGLSSSDSTGAPVIGDNVDVGVGSIIIGSIKIESDVTLGALSLVNRDISAPGVYVNKRQLTKL